jgi:hypothetical protein
MSIKKLSFKRYLEFVNKFHTCERISTNADLRPVIKNSPPQWIEELAFVGLIWGPFKAIQDLPVIANIVHSDL